MGYMMGIILGLTCLLGLSKALPMLNDGDLPPVQDVAKMARYIIHTSDWTVISHISHQGNSSDFPLGRVFSMSDGPINNSKGTPYIYSTELDPVINDLKKDSLCGMTMSLAYGDYCKDKHLDPENPLCAQVMLTGHLQFIDNNDEEAKFAKEALFSRHPEMSSWPTDHHFQFAKMNIANIQVIDYYGGSKYPSTEEYYNVSL
ncbi:unnamed protein product [Nezara viridula]|uniref:CREG-like beta-barrel domain-containing protein n=1 Tax=Nezara viridula TaxID=85310 RepID=A0A9P0HV37_NEZVI|nr:unnamed protein product [Nezara viridula]